jgi:hypothetical protein
MKDADLGEMVESDMLDMEVVEMTYHEKALNLLCVRARLSFSGCSPLLLSHIKRYPINRILALICKPTPDLSWVDLQKHQSSEHSE